jgi:uncharacterized protein YabN with tetrapyrrole methylase and pyrophosphatase domain
MLPELLVKTQTYSAYLGLFRKRSIQRKKRLNFFPLMFKVTCMKEFNELIEVAEKLLGVKGCPWDQKQTFLSLQPYVLEEAHELIEAVDGGEDEQIIEELGDLLYTVIFYGKLAEKEGRFKLEDVIKTVKEKLVRRHPHVFENVQVNNADDVVNNWEHIKQQEKGALKRKSRLDGIPATLPSLARAQKIVQRMVRAQAPMNKELFSSKTEVAEEEVGKAILQKVAEAEECGIDSESALRRVLAQYEDLFRKWESSQAHTQPT